MPERPGFSLLFVHPHPDDESIACGGVIARYVQEGATVHVVTCTRGEEGDNLAGIDLGDEDLVTHRLRELEDALAQLGVQHHTFLGYRDSGMVGTDGNANPESFHRADLYEASLRLARIVRRTRPDVVVSDDENGTYGHPDHIKAHRVTERAVAMAADAWWDTSEDGPPWQVAKRYVFTLSRSRMWLAHERLTEAGLPSPFAEGELSGPADLPFGTEDEEVTTRVDIRSTLARKRAAMRAHRSQLGEDSFFLNVPADLEPELFGVEEFVRLVGPGPAAEDDLLAGLAEGEDASGAALANERAAGASGVIAAGG